MEGETKKKSMKIKNKKIIRKVFVLGNDYM